MTRLGLVLVVVGAVGCGRIGFDLHDDAGGSGDGDASSGMYTDISDPANWEAFDTTTLSGGPSGFVGSAFDGRYLYLVPSYNGTLNGLVTRYDTQAAFSAASSWSTFDTTTLDANARGFHGGAFDGRYLYLIPSEAMVGFARIVARYDTQAAFNSAASWSTFDLGTVNSNAGGFFGAVFTGRYLYLAPYFTSTIARYDTQAAFGAPGSWATFDLTVVDPNVAAFIGGVFDGRYIYLAPFTTFGTTTGTVVRHDTQAAFASLSSWETFDSTAVHANAGGYGNAAFDGRHIYFAPYIDGPGVLDGRAVRYDTQGTFATTGAWSTFDMSTVAPSAKGFLGGGFDGRYIYFAPYPGRIVSRFDTTRGFDTAAAWSTIDLTLVHPNAAGYYGAAFDGQYLYLVAHTGGVVVRFDARTPPAMPGLPAFHGSFL